MAPPRRPLLTAWILAIGSELTTGSTAETNSGELAAELMGLGLDVLGIAVVPDRLPAIRDALGTAIRTVDLTITTGGLGPTPDDLTREAIAAVCGATPEVDAGLLGELRGLFMRRGLPMPEANVKQAWIIPGARTLENRHGTAPGWWVDRADGRVIIALPGPPSEMRPMWRDVVRPMMTARGAGTDQASETLRLTGIGESALVSLIGGEVLGGERPEVATFARPDAVDLRVVARGDGAAQAVSDTVTALLPALRPYLFARATETWADALSARLHGRTVALAEIGTAGQLAALLGTADWLTLAEVIGPRSGLARTHRDLRALAQRVREVAGSDVGLAVRASERRGDTAVTIAIALADRAAVRQVTRTAFLSDDEGRRRAAIAACAELWRRLG